MSDLSGLMIELDSPCPVCGTMHIDMDRIYLREHMTWLSKQEMKWIKAEVMK